MVLYAAKLKASAKPVSDLSSVEKKVSAKSKKKDVVEQVVEDAPTPPMDKKEQAKLKRREKALLKKQQEEDELKRQEEEAQSALAQKEAELKAAEDALKMKKDAQKEKRKLKRDTKKVQIDESVTESNPSINSTEATFVAESIETKPVKKTRKRKQVTIEEQVDQAVAELPADNSKDIEPPQWFKKYVAGVKNEESQHRSPKKAKRVIAKEANQVATEQWGNGFVRDRVRNEVDQHMSRMYQMIFNRGL